MIPILNIISQRPHHDRHKRIEKLCLSGQHLGPRALDIKLFRAVDFGKALSSGRPFDIEGIAGQLCRIKWPAPASAMTRLPPRCRISPQRLEGPNRSARAEFFGKLAPRDVLRSVSGIDSLVGMDQTPSSLLRQSGPPG